MLVYIAGPLTPCKDYTEAHNLEIALMAYIALVRARIVAFCPHLSIYADLHERLTYEEWMTYDLAIIDQCTHLLMLPRWSESPGAVREHAYARQQGKTIVYNIRELLP
jgi:hypothetical protein